MEKPEGWHEKRRRAIGASDLAKLFGLSPWGGQWELWADKTGRLERWEGNDATRAGNAFENAVLDVAETTLGKLQRDILVPCQGVPLVSICDALVTATGQPVEAKTTGLVGPVYGDWGDELTDQVPEYYLVQVHAQLMCTRAELGYLFALIPGRGVVEYRVEAAPKLYDHFGNVVSDWWDRHIVKGVEPPRDIPPSLEVVKRLKRQPAKSIELRDGTQELIKSLAMLKDNLKLLGDRKKEVEAALLLELGDAEQGVLPDGTAVTYLESERKGYTVQPTKYRTLRIKKKGKKDGMGGD